MGFALAIGALVGGLALSGSNDALKDQEEAIAAQAAERRRGEEIKKRQANADARREKVKQIREGRIRRARILAGAGNEGVGLSGTSSVVGGTSSVASQVGSNISYINSQQQFANALSDVNQNVADYQSEIFSAGAKAQQWQQIGNIGESIFNAGGGFTSIFGGNTF